MKYIFYCIYNTQYLNGNNIVNKTPWFNALGLMIAGTMCWIAVIVEVIYFFFLNRNFPSISLLEVLTICTLLFYVHYYFFIKENNYEVIYEEYKTKSNNIGKERLVAVLYIFVPALLSMLIAILWHRVF